MKHRCECGKPAIGFARTRGKSGRATRTGRPVSRKEHGMCPACWRKWCDRFRMDRAEIDERTAMSKADLDALEAEQRKPENRPAWFDEDTERYGRLDAEGVREPVVRVRGRGMCVVLNTLRE